MQQHVSRVGIYAGTFDPVHRGHLAFAQAAITQCWLSKVVFLPERSPRSKKAVTAFSHRLALLEAATADLPAVEVLVLKDAQFSVAKTLPVLQKRYADSKLVFLLGADVVCGSLAAWPHIASLLTQAAIAVGLREGYTAAAVETTFRNLHKQVNVVGRYELIEAAYADASSSRLRVGGDAAHLHKTSRAYIRRHGLYA